MTSLMLSIFPINITNLSIPSAMPPCGGAPYSRDFSKKPKFSSILLSLKPRVLKIFFCRSILFILIEPQPISLPLSTISYASENTFSGSFSKYFIVSGVGLVKGWCVGDSLFSF